MMNHCIDMEMLQAFQYLINDLFLFYYRLGSEIQIHTGTGRWAGYEKKE